MPDIEKHEKRRHFRGKPRAGRRVELHYRDIERPDDAFVSAITQNIGVGGAYILTHDLHHVGTKLVIKLDVPTDDEPIMMTADVRWTAPAADDTDMSGMGVRFYDVDVDSLLRLSEYFASLTGTDD